MELLLKDNCFVEKSAERCCFLQNMEPEEIVIKPIDVDVIIGNREYLF
jgi:hypothetical protein